MNEAIIEPGQIWRDKSAPSRRLKVQSVDAETVTAASTHSTDDAAFDDLRASRLASISRKRFTAAFTVEQPIGTETERVAREEVGRHYDDHVATARKAYEEAAAAFAGAKRARAAWHARGQITSRHPGAAHDNPHPGLVAGEVLGITASSQSRYMKAANVAIDNRGDAQLHAEAEAAHGRMEALLRWLTAQGYDLGAFGRPAHGSTDQYISRRRGGTR